MLYNPHQTAKMLGVSKQTLIRWEQEKKISPAKRNYLNHRVYTMEDIEKIKEEMGLGILKEPSPKQEEEKQCQK